FRGFDGARSVRDALLVWRGARSSAWLRADPLTLDRSRLVAVGLLAVGLVMLLGVGFALPSASDAPTLRATVETVVTLFAFAAAWVLRAQFVYSGRLGDLLVAGAVLALGLVHLCWYTLPAALHLSLGGLFAGAALWSDVFVAGVF